MIDKKKHMSKIKVCNKCRNVRYFIYKWRKLMKVFQFQSSRLQHHCFTLTDKTVQYVNEANLLETLKWCTKIFYKVLCLYFPHLEWQRNEFLSIPSDAIITALMKYANSETLLLFILSDNALGFKKNTV